MKTNPGFHFAFAPLALLLAVLVAPSNSFAQRIGAGTAPAAQGFLNTDLGTNDLPARPSVPQEVVVQNGTRLSIGHTNGAGTTSLPSQSLGAGALNLTNPPTDLAGISNAAIPPALNGPAVVAVPEPGSSVLFLTLAAFPLFKLLRGSRKTRAS